MSHANDLWGAGIYTLAEASRISGIPVQRLRRWLVGYRYRVDGGARQLPPVFESDAEIFVDGVALSFRDLMECRFVDFFRSKELSLPTIRLVSERASQWLGHGHPFATRRFSTDGKRILGQVAEDEEDANLLDMISDQTVMGPIIAPFLYRNLEFDVQEIVVRWWPLGADHTVLIDPRRSFGQPVIFPETVPTTILAKAVEVEGSTKAASAIYEVPERSVEEAVEYENLLAAA